jgi:diguanylate cyclase (GGDEF)-like protein
MEVLRLTRDEKTSVKDLAAVIEKDPALALRILRLVNSAFVGMPREVGSIHRAIVVLGIRTTKLLTLGFSLTSAVHSRNGNGRGFDFRTYWRRSIIHAVAARLLAQIVAPRLREEAFIGGLLADVGVVAAWQCVPDEYEGVLASSSSLVEPLHRIESRMLGVSHARIGEDLLDHWNIPEPVCHAVGAHHGDGLTALSGESLELARVISAAAWIAAFLCSDPPALELPAVEEQVRKLLSVSPEDVAKVLESLEGHVAETASLLSVNIDTTIGAMIQAQATLRVAQLTHEMEAECCNLAKREATAREQADRLIEEQKAVILAASTDPLTGLKNRAVFDGGLADCLTRAARSKNHVALLLLDVDHFKQVNDTYGHGAGDCVLRGVGKVLSGALREADVAVRYGGEEFAIITEHENHAGAGVMAERVREAVAKASFSYNGQNLSVTVSIGVACWHGSTKPVAPNVITEMADKALYAAKREGRNQVRLVYVM